MLNCNMGVNLEMLIIYNFYLSFYEVNYLGGHARLMTQIQQLVYNLGCFIN